MCAYSKPVRVVRLNEPTLRFGGLQALTDVRMQVGSAGYLAALQSKAILFGIAGVHLDIDVSSDNAIQVPDPEILCATACRVDVPAAHTRSELSAPAVVIISTNNSKLSIYDLEGPCYLCTVCKFKCRRQY